MIVSPNYVQGIERGNTSLYTDVVFFFFLCSFRKHRRARKRARTSAECEKEKFFFPLHYSLVLAVNKSPGVYILSPALDRLSRENEGSVNRLSNYDRLRSTNNYVQRRLQAGGRGGTPFYKPNEYMYVCDAPSGRGFCAVLV